MPHTNTPVRVAGTLLAIASALLIAALVLHGPRPRSQRSDEEDCRRGKGVVGDPLGFGHLLIPVCDDRTSRTELGITPGRRLVDDDGVGGVDRERPLDHDYCRC